MSYNSKIHNRRSIRLKGYDYSQAGSYFITICCHNKECLFGKIEKDIMILNEYGNAAYTQWIQLTERFSNFELDTFQIMPNHMHGIIVLNDVGATLADAHVHGATARVAENGATARVAENGATARVARTTEVHSKSVGDIVGAYKSLVANKCLEIFKAKYVNIDPPPIMGKLWHRNFYEHIIRNEKSYQTISNYIINNPVNWQGDKFYHE